ncbi:MAG: YiiX/YebB-like N1pC/P60 family cysteine hydrolase [Geobacteraceae bacterium]|nr:YiiX/YebB-like N1pC/P60 family cysteine hydrolase [Geobacteraceae bacterium]
MSDFSGLPFKRYNEIRDQIQSGDILLCSGDYVSSRLTRQANGSCWNHVAFVLRLDSIDWIVVLESIVDKGIRVIPLSEYVKNYEGTGKGYRGKLVLGRHAEFSQKVTTDALKRVFKFAFDRFFAPYDEQEVARITARTAGRFLGFKKNEIERKHEYSCSEYVHECYRMLGIDVCYDDSWFVAPSDFAVNDSLRLLWELETES